MSTGKVVAQSMLLGSYGALVYNSVRANTTTSKGHAFANAVLANSLNNVTLGWLGRHSKW